MTDVLEEAMRAVNNGEVRSQGQDRKDYSVVKPMILQLLGDAKRGSRYWRRAAQHYKEAAESFRENDLKAKCYTDAACCFVKLGNKTEADRNYQKALALVSDDMKEALAVYYQEGQK